MRKSKCLYAPSRLPKCISYRRRYYRIHQQSQTRTFAYTIQRQNFVFDERLGERITDDVIAECHQCGTKADTHTNCKNEACHLLFIQCPTCADEFNGCCSQECADTLKLSPEERAELRKGKDNGQMIFSKSKHHPLRKHRDEWKKENKLQ